MENKNIDVLEALEKDEEKKGIPVYPPILKKKLWKIKVSLFIERLGLDKFKRNLPYINFLFKYSLSSLFIFILLLVATNYSAYFNIAESYVFKEDFEKNEKSIMTSVNATYVKEKGKEKILEGLKKEKIKENKNYSKNYHQISKIIKKINEDDIDINIEMIPYENRIVIPKIGKNIPLIDVEEKKISSKKELNNIFMKELEKGVVRYPSSGIPGYNGNTFIFGHSSNFPWIKGDYNDIFSLLDKVIYDDEIIVYYGQKKYTYKIREKKIISPSNISILNRNKNKSEITLMTCRPIGTTLKRLIVIGDLVEGE